MIVGAEQVAVREQYSFVAERNHRRVCNKRDAGLGLEALTVEKIAVALHHEGRNPAPREIA